MLSKLLLPGLIMLGLASNMALASNLPVNQGIDDDIVGVYTCKGSDPATHPADFVGKITITKHKNQYIMASETDKVGKKEMDTYNEFAIRQGHHLVIAFQDRKDLKIFGVEHMTIDNQGKDISGTFAYWGAPDQIGIEKCHKNK